MFLTDTVLVSAKNTDTLSSFCVSVVFAKTFLRQCFLLTQKRFFDNIENSNCVIMSESGATATGIGAFNPVQLPNGEIINTATAGRVDPSLVRCHRKGCTSLGWKYLHNKCTEANKHKHNWAYCESCYKDSQKNRKNLAKNTRKKRQ